MRFEVFVEVPLAVAESRDVKGLYKKVRRRQVGSGVGPTSASFVAALPQECMGPLASLGPT